MDKTWIGQNIVFWIALFMTSQNTAAMPVEQHKQTDRQAVNPVIGVSAQLVNADDPSSDSYIAASYVKYLESAGARVIPIPSSMPEDELQQILPHLNGYLFPGGGAHMIKSGYYHHAKQAFQHSKDSYENGTIFPVWGTCLGFETLMVLAAGNDESVLGKSDSDDVSLPLDFTVDALGSKMFSGASMEVMLSLQKENLTYNHHKRCLTYDSYRQNEGLSEFFKVLSTNTDPNGVTFVSSAEGRRYPIFATQWHPEKNAYEFGANLHFPHSEAAIKIAQYLANMFVEQCRRNRRVFPADKLSDMIIYNYLPTFSGKSGSHFEQIYLFK